MFLLPFLAITVVVIDLVDCSSFSFCQMYLDMLIFPERQSTMTWTKSWDEFCFCSLLFSFLFFYSISFYSVLLFASFHQQTDERDQGCYLNLIFSSSSSSSSSMIDWSGWFRLKGEIWIVCLFTLFCVHLECA